MKRFAVVFEESAQTDVRDSYDWGCRVWGKRQAQKWASQLRSAAIEQLGIAPNGFPLAPEVSEFSEERSAKWSLAVIEYCSRPRAARSMSSTSEELQFRKNKPPIPQIAPINSRGHVIGG
jgi:plasmid stabilization system protein ParE